MTDQQACTWCGIAITQSMKHAPPEASGPLCRQCRGFGAPWTVPDEPAYFTGRHKREQADTYTTSTWGTGPREFVALHDVFNFQVDLAASPGNAKLPYYITAAENALEVRWPSYGSRGFINPPKAFPEPFLERAIYFRDASSFTTVALVEMATHKDWVPRAVALADRCLFLLERPKFISPAGLEGQGFGDAGWAVLIYSPVQWPIQDIDLAFWYYDTSGPVLHHTRGG